MNRPSLMERRKELRNHGTSAEATLWKLLKGKQIEGLKFRRQHSVGSYILDFYCPEIRIAVELDGEVHHSPQAEEYDERRSDYLLKTQGIIVLRFENQMVFVYPEGILNSIVEYKDRYKDGR
ncbi:hypothetical protein EZS27_025163 [termite gut metagenome]|uniref:DUF559 domain-containing protein n=1 Tax=termite gut metagenome TaxID=433724 RepID=A0A5J4QUR8_9ZZZZ